jgi:hypothetical protein
MRKQRTISPHRNTLQRPSGRLTGPADRSRLTAQDCYVVTRTAASRCDDRDVDALGRETDEHARHVPVVDSMRDGEGVPRGRGGALPLGMAPAPITRGLTGAKVLRFPARTLSQ